MFISFQKQIKKSDIIHPKNRMFFSLLWMAVFRMTEHPLEPRIAYIHGIQDIRKIEGPAIDKLKTLFDKHPLLIFKDIPEITPKEFLHFVKQFDPEHDALALENPTEYPHQMLQPFDQFPDCAHVAPRGNIEMENLHSLKRVKVRPYKAFIDQYVWHADMIGHEYKLPGVVTGFYVLENPLIGGDTDFISGESVYEGLTSKEQLASQNVLIELNRRKFVMGEVATDYAGIQRTEEHVEMDIGNTQIPLLFAPHSENASPSILLMPTFFERVVGWTVKESRQWMREFMIKRVLPHRVSIQWKRGDLAVFNNRRFIHSSTPARNYLDNLESDSRLLLQTFVPTTKPLLGIKPKDNNCYACYNANWIKDQEKAIISAHHCIQFAVSQKYKYNTTVMQNPDYYVLAAKPE
jgi:alpha-ketoglutarate-dependent taurine dioxygenase